MDIRATYVIPREFIKTCMDGGEFQEGVPVNDVVRVEKTDMSILIKYRKHETRSLKKLTDETLKEVKARMFEETPLVNCRSLIFTTDGEMISFTPPKSVASSMLETPVFEEFVEGTMMSVFYHPTMKTWEIATRSIIGGRNHFYKDTDRNSNTATFRKMFLDAMTDSKLEFEMLSQDYCYTFVVQHPQNRVVVPFSETALYLVGMYRIYNDSDVYRIEEMDLQTCNEPFMKRIRLPQRYEGTMDEIHEKYASEATAYSVVGVMMRDDVRRSKMRNPVYERIRRLRGNQPKQQYQYLALRKEGRIREYLKAYPEMRKLCAIWRSQIHSFTNHLHSSYLNVFVFHKTPIQQISYEYRPHVIALHEKYVHELKSNNEKITKTVVMNYVNNLPVPRLMFCMNAPMRNQHRQHKQSLQENTE